MTHSTRADGSQTASSANNATFAARDLRHVWHPCTQMKDHETMAPIPVRRGNGVWLEDFEGKRYLDAISSWWMNLFGHANERISGAWPPRPASSSM